MTLWALVEVVCTEILVEGSALGHVRGCTIDMLAPLVGAA